MTLVEGEAMTLDDVVTMLLAEAIDEYVCSLNGCTCAPCSYARAASFPALEANAETQQRARRAGWVYR